MGFFPELVNVRSPSGNGTGSDLMFGRIPAGSSTSDSQVGFLLRYINTLRFINSLLLYFCIKLDCIGGVKWVGSSVGVMESFEKLKNKKYKTFLKNENTLLDQCQYMYHFAGIILA